MSVKQRTLKSEFSLNGKGLHTGKQVTATFKPAEENFGYRIRRMDLEGSPEIPALAEYVKLMDRASCLEKDGVCVFTMEHAMAALYGCGIDNCLAGGNAGISSDIPARMFFSIIAIRVLPP